MDDLDYIEYMHVLYGDTPLFLEYMSSMDDLDYMEYMHTLYGDTPLFLEYMPSMDDLDYMEYMHALYGDTPLFSWNTCPLWMTLITLNTCMSSMEIHPFFPGIHALYG